MKKSISLLGAILLMATQVDAQFFPTRENPNHGKKATVSKKDKSPAKDGKELAKIKKSSKEIPGLFPMLQDTTNATMYMWVSDEQIGKEFIYFSQVADGVLAGGFFRGAYRGSRILKVERYFDHIDFRRINTSYHFDENNALSKAENANINNPVLFSAKIVESQDGKHLIKADGLFISESLAQVKPTPNPRNKGFSLGRFDKSLSRVAAVRNYPENTDVKVNLVYKNPYPKGSGAAVTDPRMVEVSIYHSLIAMPENDYRPRRDDPRIGYFTTQTQDMTSLSHTPYRDMIHRWYLEKQNKDAEFSKPVEPIVWWIENTTPKEYRETIRTGVLRWNKAFEAVGFKNAVEVRIQPDTASWDAGDIRYNVLRWTSSPVAPFGGYGPSFVNPRTGQILGADIMLEWVSISNRLKREEVFASAAMSMYSEEENLEEIAENFDANMCFIGDMMNQQTVFANTAFDALDLSEVAKKDFVKQILYRLVLHEVGHTLGLNHNMKASSWMSYEDIKNPEMVRKHGLCNSVMEYPAINFPLDKENHSMFYDDNIGPYDMWVINYGYSPGLEYDQEEELRLQDILSESTKPEHMFGNDADDMRSPGKGIDPRVNIYDLSADPVAYAVDRIKLVHEVMPNILTKIPKEGESYHRLRNAYLGLTGEMATSLSVISKQIGGVHINRSLVGQEEGAIPYTPVSYETQKEAMNAIKKYALAPNAFEDGEKVYRYLQPQRRGFNFFANTEDPKLHDRWLGIQQRSLAHLMHPRVTKRMTDAALYGNKYSVAEMFGDLTDGIFAADRYKAVSTNRQNIQTYYVQRLGKMIADKSPYDGVTKAAALAQLKSIKSLNANASKPDASTKAHRAYVDFLIEKALDTSN